MVALYLLLVAMTLVYLVYRRKAKKLPPGPLGLPLVGYTPFVGSNPAATYNELRKKYGPLFSLQLGSEQWIILNSYEVINEALVKRGHQFSGRPINAVFETLSGSGRGVIFTDYCDRWKVQREFCAKSLKRQGTRKCGFEDLIAEEARYLIEAFQLMEGKKFDPKISLEKATANVTLGVTVGSRMSYDDKELADMIHCINDFATEPVDGALFGLMFFFPMARFLPRFRTTFSKIQYSQRRICEIMKRFVNEHKSTFDPEHPRDLLDEFLKKAAQLETGFFSDLQLIQILCDMFEAGMSTTADTMLWIFLLLAHFPAFQDKIASEIHDAIGQGGIPSTRHRKVMPHTCAFIQEAQRMYPTAPLSVPRKTTTEVRMLGYEIPKGTLAIANLYGAHRDPENFKDPEVFRPERFIDDDGNFVPSNRVIPFSFGPRNCMGEQLARKQLFIFLASIVGRFRIESDPDEPLPPLGKGTYGLIYSPLPFNIRLVPI